MSEVKWIKIVTDIFDDEKMLLIDGLPEHDAIIVIWFKLLCLAGKQNNGGVFIMNDKIAYTEEMLATIFHRPLNTVRLALETFSQYGMIEIFNGTIAIPNWEKHQSLDTYEKKKERDRLYQAERRARQKDRIPEIPEKSSDNRLTSDDESSLVAVTDTEEDKEEDKDIDISSLSSPERCPYSKIKDLYHEICVSFPTIKTLDGERKKAVGARWRTYKTLEAFEDLFRIAESSRFLKGENDRNWSADFDWMMKATNFSKIREHKYDNLKKDNTEGKSFETDSFFEAALARTMGGQNGKSDV